MRSAFLVLLHTNVFVAGCAVALCVATDAQLDGRIEPFPLYLLVSGGTLVAYNVHALVNQSPHNHSAFSVFVRRMQLACLVLGIVLAGVSVFFLRFEVMVATALLGLAAMLYSTPLLPFRYKQRLKDFGLLKVAVLTGVWTLVTTLLPALASGMALSELTRVLWPEAVLRTLFILPLCLAFDIRDIESDRAAGINTVPVSVGIAPTYLLAYLLLVICAAMAWFRSWPHWNAVAVFLATFYAACAIAYSRRYGSATAYLFWIDGAMGLYALLQILPLFWPGLRF